MANLLSTTVNGSLNVQGSSMYVTASQLHIGKASSGTAQMSFESWGSYTGAIAMNSSGAFHWGGQGNSEWYFKKNSTYNGDYSASGTTVLRIASDGNIYSAYYGDWLSNVFNSKQNASTAITTSNIGSQSVNYANSSGVTEFQNIPDARGNAYTPNAYTGQRVWWHFNNTDTVGGYGTFWHAIQTVSPWTSYDSSHRQQQIQWGGTDISFRYATSGTTWSSWFRFITDANIASQSVNYADESGYSASSGSVEWTSVQNKPSTFTPSAHTHSISDVTGLQTALNGKLSTTGTAANSSQLEGFSAYALVSESRGAHSVSDFPNGTLVTTDINASEWAGDSFVMEVSGKSYGSGTPFKLAMEGYLYADTIINVSAMSYGSYFPAPVKVMNLDGTLAFWWPRGSYWNSFEVHVRAAGGESWNRVTGISDSVDPPSATKKISITPVQVIHTNNIGSQSVSYATSAGDASTLGGFGRGNTTNKVAYFDGDRNLYVNNPESYTGEVRLGAAWNRGGVYASSTLSMATSGGAIDFVSNDNIIGAFRWDSTNGSRFIVGQNVTTTPHTLIDSNRRPVIYSRGAYPVLTLDHTETGNGSHGPTIQFAHNGTATNNRQWVIGTNGTGTRLDFGYSEGGSNTSYNPHNGIDDYQGTTWMRIDSSGAVSKIGALSLRNGFTISQGGSDYASFNSWVYLPGVHGFYSAVNGAHFYPNNGSYGAWRIAGTRGGWNGIEFDASNGNVSLMVNPNSNTTGFHNNAYGWQFYWENGTLYCNKNSYGAGTTATVLDSSNYTSYTLPRGGSWYGSGLPGSRWGGFSVSGGEIVFGDGLPNAGQMGILIDGAYLAGENNGFWSLASDNSWSSRRGMYWDGSNLNFTANSPTALFNSIRLSTSTNNGTISGGGDWGIRFANDNGWIQFGPANNSWTHIYSDKNFYMNNHLWVSGGYKVTAWDYNNGGGALYATVFYDANDTGYYLDPNGTSNLLQLNTSTRARWNMPRTWYDRSSRTSDENYWTGTNGWGTADGTWANAWRGGFSGWDIWGTGTDHPQGGGYVHAQGIVSGQHYASSSIGYGWMMVGAHNATENRYWLRGKWDTSTSGWTEMMTSNQNPIAWNMDQYVRTSDSVSFNSTTSPTFLVNNQSDNTKGYRIYNTSNASVSAMFTNSANALVIGAGAFDQVQLNKKVLVSGAALGVNVAASATAGRIDASNDIVAYSSSDERLKHNITPIENALDKVKSLTGVEFDWKPEYKHAHGYEGHDTGIIAQQVQEVIPSAVRTNDTGFLAVRYEKLIGLLVEGMKEQQAQIEELKAKLDGLTK